MYFAIIQDQEMDCSWIASETPRKFSCPHLSNAFETFRILKVTYCVRKDCVSSGVNGNYRNGVYVMRRENLNKSTYTSDGLQVGLKRKYHNILQQRSIEVCERQTKCFLFRWYNANDKRESLLLSCWTHTFFAVRQAANQWNKKNQLGKGRYACLYCTDFFWSATSPFCVLLLTC